MEVSTIMTQVTNALSTGMAGVADGMAGAVSAVIPVAIPVLGAALVVNFGIKTFKAVTR